MAQKKYQVITRFLAVSLAFLITIQAGACGWGDDYETLRLAFFKAETKGMRKYKPAYYTEHYLNTDVITSDADRWRNCAEWQQSLGNGVTAKDIFTIQYETSPEDFRKNYDAKLLDTFFEGNTFIKALLKPKNKPLLEYLVFAKQMEYEGGTSATAWESWDDEEPRNYWDRNGRETDTITDNYSRFIPVEKRLTSCSDRFLQERYAFMLIRYGNKDKVKTLYNKYFENNSTTSVVKAWAMLFRAYSATDKAEQNYYMSRCFDLCEEKVVAVLQWYNYGEKNSTLKLAKSDHERAVIIAIDAMRNPGPAFEEIKQVMQLAPNSAYVNLLVAREVNKFEDWLFYTKMKGNSPNVYSDTWGEESYMDIRNKNYRNDIKYLRSFSKYLIVEYGKAKAGSKHDFLAAVLSHLCFMDDNIADGYKYASAISNEADSSIQVQKNIELALVAAKQGDIASPTVQQKLYDAFAKIQEITAEDMSYSKSMYTLLKILATEYNSRGDVATANLVFLKGDNFKYRADGYGYSGSDETYDYSYLGYLDQYAKTRDVDNLITLIEKKNKTSFEKFICSATTAKKEYYLDFKGKLAFRQNNLRLAYETFKQIPDSTSQKFLIYSEYDSIDPFFPSVLNYGRPLVKNQKTFTKASFVKGIIDLQTKTDADSYLKLGHAYYNTSYMGNAWFMCAYYQGNMWWEISFGSLYSNKEQYSNGNYANLTLAKQYYRKALNVAKNNEQRAMATLMLYVRNNKDDYNNTYYWDKPKKHQPGKWLNDFYGVYNNTETFKQYSCPSLEYYLK